MEKITPQPKKPKYRVLISTKSSLAIRQGSYSSILYKKWFDDYQESGFTEDYLNDFRTIQGNQVNYFIPINE